MKVDLKSATTGQTHNYLLSLVTPRPIAFASTIDQDGNVNLSPFSFFNAFSANPPILIFSPSRRGRDNTVKHTWMNVHEVPEVVINIVDYQLVQQMSLSSAEFARGVNEFTKAGLTDEPSVMVKPPRVKEAPAAIECKVNQIISLGEEGGAGQLVICEALYVHIKDTIIDDNGKVDPQRLDAVGRLGGNWYSRAHGEAVFEVPKPTTGDALGIDQLPESIRNSTVLSGNDLGMLGNVTALPSDAEVQAFRNDDPQLSEIMTSGLSALELAERLHEMARQFLRENDLRRAWLTLLQTRL